MPEQHAHTTSHSSHTSSSQQHAQGSQQEPQVGEPEPQAQPPHDFPGQSPPPKTKADPSPKAGVPPLVNVYSFTVHLQSDLVAENHSGRTVAVVAGNLQDAQKAVSDAFGDNLVNVFGGTPTFVGAFLAASAASGSAGGSGAKGVVGVQPPKPQAAGAAKPQVVNRG